MSAHRFLQNIPRYSTLLRSTRSCVRQIPAPQPQQRLSVAFISTSKKNRDTTTTGVEQREEIVTPKTVEDFANPSKKNYQTYGFELDPEEDINVRNMIMFFTITVVMVMGGWLIAYDPDKRFRDWYQREAYFELARREALGLPLVDPDLVPVENIELPSEEELADFEVII